MYSTTNVYGKNFRNSVMVSFYRFYEIYFAVSPTLKMVFSKFFFFRMFESKPIKL